MAEFERLYPVDRVPVSGTAENLEATPAEREKLAKRFDLVELAQFTGRLLLKPWRRGGVKVEGTMQATMTQTCVVSLDEFTTSVTVPVERYFLGQTNAGATQVTAVVSLEEDDEPDLIQGNSIDLGELAAECLGLSLDLYPRKPGVAFDFSGDPPAPAPEPKRNPFASLAKLRQKGD